MNVMNTAASSVSLPTDEERELLRTSVRGLLAQHWNCAEAEAGQAVSDPDRLVTIETRLAGLGLGELGRDISCGGTREMVAVAEELGRSACPSLLLGAMVAQRMLAGGAHGTLAAQLEQLGSGSARLALALGPFDGDPHSGNLAHGPTGWSGTLDFIEGAQAATHFLAVVNQGAGASGLLLLRADAPGLAVVPTPGLCAAPLARLEFRNAEGTHFPWPEAQLRELVLLLRLLLAARAHGAARRAFESVVEHAGVRVQFGQPIGRFQAIQHRLADSFTALEGVRLTLDHAARMHDEGSQRWSFHAAAAAAFAGEALRTVSLHVHHTFGAIGYSEEHEAPRHFRRVHEDLARLGGVRASREALAAWLLDDGGRSIPDDDLGPAGNAFRSEVRDWIAQRWEGCWREQFESRPFHERRPPAGMLAEFGERGWMSLSWPEAFGGQARGPMEQLAFAEELQAAGVPKPGGDIQAHALMRFGTPQQQAEYLPRIRAGTLRFCLGYSEPSAGSDLSALRTSAVRDGTTGDWIINGQKLWTTYAEDADCMWLAARTDPNAAQPHAGISVFIVPMNTPGITIRPSMAMYGHTFCTEFLDNVRVPASALVGEVNQGWKIITAALATERVTMGSFVAFIRANFNRLVQEVRARPALAGCSAVRERLGTLMAEIEVARRLVMLSAAMAERGNVPVHEAAMSKCFTGELMERVGEAALEILGTGATLAEGATGAITDGRLQQMLRQGIMFVIGGGTNDIQRTLIAQRGLGLPR